MIESGLEKDLRASNGPASFIEKSARAPMPPLDFSQQLGLGHLALLEGSVDVYVDAAPNPK